MKPAAPTEGGKRRQGLADKDTMKGKKTRSLSEDSVVAPVEEQAKTKTKCVNTYRLESRNKFRDCLVRDKAQQILTSKLQQASYDGVSSPLLCASISEEILKAVKEFGFDRYKYVVSVLIVEKTDQAMIVASRCLWDVQRDNWVSAKCETETFIALALVMACYYD
ncbi:tctex1 domain-containing protein 3 isoform X1 [Corapipo altera]|uniref:tctex1 domain-containing protein 3 isoform X1 n=2 Tax=Corapipo altera TaxID=415028 RepID=UPI000FD64E85|nr:tctex1 domain-containing protein 3 isoform X1 [Corapipo altera]